MSKVVHLSDEAHSAAKNFCKQHGLKMSDWVAELIKDAIANNRVSPSTSPAPQAPARPRVAGASLAPSAPAPRNHSSGAVPVKKKLERFEEPPPSYEDGIPPWAAPPFWAKAQSK